MNFYYSTRRDKVGNLIMTSYKDEKSVKKYGGDGKIEHDLYALDSGQISRGGHGLPVRSVLVNNGSVKEENAAGIANDPFVIYTKNSGVWEPTKHSFPQYGLANSAMKNMIPYHKALAIVYVGEEIVESVQADETDLDILG